LSKGAGRKEDDTYMYQEEITAGFGNDFVSPKDGTNFFIGAD